MLVENGADVNAQGGWYGNALQAASSEGHTEIAQMLVQNGADVNAHGGWYSNALYSCRRRWSCWGSMRKPSSTHVYPLRPPHRLGWSGGPRPTKGSEVLPKRTGSPSCGSSLSSSVFCRVGSLGGQLS
jgi:hypothetical protein